MIEVYVPTRESPKEEIERICDILQMETEIMGFVFRATIQEAIYGNSLRLNLLAAKLDGTIVGALMITGRRPYPHVWKCGNVYVIPEARRQRVGTALYTAAACMAVLEGRRMTQDDVILDYSPWMIRERQPSDDCRGGPGFLISLNYQYAGTFPEITTGFKTIEPWIKNPILGLNDYLGRLYPGTRIHLVETASSKKNYEENYAKYITRSANLASELYLRAAELRGNLIPGIEVT